MDSPEQNGHEPSSEAAAPSHAVTQLLEQIALGSPAAHDRLLPLVYDELRRMARRQMGSERREHSLQPTALVHEAWLRFARMGPTPWQDRLHFFAVAATLMRRILVDHARERIANKRGGGCAVVTLDGMDVPGQTASTVDMLALNQSLERLEALDARQARVVELRYFAGMGDEEIAELLQVSTRTVKRDWRVAKAFLFQQLSG